MREAIAGSSMEEMLLSDLSLLAICLFLHRRKSRVDLKDLKEAFCDVKKIESNIKDLGFAGIIEISKTGKAKSKRISLSASGSHCVSELIEAANNLRTEKTKQLNGISIDGEVAYLTVTDIIPAASDKLNISHAEYIQQSAVQAFSYNFSDKMQIEESSIPLAVDDEVRVTGTIFEERTTSSDTLQIKIARDRKKRSTSVRTSNG